MGQHLLTAAQRWPHRPWCTTPAGTVSRAEAIDRARCVAGGLSAAGLKPGDPVLVVLPNSLEFLAAWFGAILAGLVPVAMNPRAADQEATAVLTELDARVIVAGGDTELTTSGLPDGVRVLDVASLLTGDPAAELHVDQDVRTPVTYLQSSGSTGRPKFIAHSHLAQVLAAEAFPYWLGLTDRDTMLTALPLAHGNAQIYSVLGSFGLGAQLILLPRFSASTFWADVNEYRATEFNAIGAMIEILMRQEPSDLERSHRVRLCYTAPAYPQDEHLRIEDRFNLHLVLGYAQSEGGCAGMTMPLSGWAKYGSMGRPRQHPRHGDINSARIIDATGQRLPAGEVGELELWTATPTPGYLNMPAETEALFHDGWLRTGDLAYADEDGFYFFAGRIKEIIRHRGENLSPAEVELAIDAHPEVSATAVIGVPSEMTEEDIKAFVVLRPGADLDAAGLRTWCEQRLPPYKRPRFYEFVEELPLTHTNKIAKHQLAKDRNANEVDVLSLS
ncbi:MAG TPA: AMP-binding protein [Trebonia sp.]